MVTKNIPRLPTKDELDDLSIVETRELYGRKYTKAEWQCVKECSFEQYIAVFDDYCFDYYDYRGKLMVVVSPTYGNCYRVFIWYKGKLRWIPQDTYYFDGTDVSYAKLTEQ